MPAGTVSPLLLRKLWTWLIAAIVLFIVFVALMMPDLAKPCRLMFDGIKTSGTRVIVPPEHHTECHYNYLVGGKNYVGTGVGCIETPAGTQVPVYYLRDHPEVSSNDPGTEFWTMGVPLLLITFVVPFFVVAGVTRKRYT